MNKSTRVNLTTAVFGLGLVWLAWIGWGQDREVEVVPYSVFEQQLREGRVAEVTVGDQRVTGTLKVPDARGKKVLVSTPVEPAMAERLSGFGVAYKRVREATWVSDLMGWILPVLILVGFWGFMARRMAGSMGGGLMGIGRSKAKVYMEKSTGVCFDDVAGVDEAKTELREIVEFLRNPQHYGRLGARVPKGVLLMGPTGTGKTLLARAVAGEAGVPFFSISGSEFIEMFVGVGAARVRDLFEQARRTAPAIIFIDELDALGKARGVFPVSGGHDEREQTLNQLLVELDGFDPSVGVVLLAATNRPEILDPALLRAGRFDRQVLVDRPDRDGRTAILKVHARKVPLAPEVDLDLVAAITVGFAGADLANVVNEAALVATRRDAKAVTLEDFTQAIERIVAGIEKKRRLISPRERQLVATHELGHALTALALPGADRVHKVSIVPHGVGALGYTLQRPTEDRHLMQRTQLMDKLTVLLGGRAAEVLVFGEPSTGAADDLAKATDIARDMVLRFGMDQALGPVVYAGVPATMLLPQDGATGALPPAAASPATAQRIDDAVRGLLEGAQARATDMLRRHREVLDRCVKALLDHETLNEAELLALAAPLRDLEAAQGYIKDRTARDAAPSPA
ncbi:ATP-dependent zinc metalloprotease FtsH [Aquabacterium sp. A7-Y]|uniref:ATP-dependent zinc metalloprotease FtsH n=1 Tax=Aquabacterium sp. A7-Y TaxID=1349605 RepID=UPI00223D4020|nr:ATP-dependent zinc metalloprotease FtsH [Aquabacterium sp. A7-Y]MCW7541194.1 ATP-dependent zinc metalloprotease FtsH [Aquabacterium sp. A7-Y]